jgi:hypothetical protein
MRAFCIRQAHVSSDTRSVHVSQRSVRGGEVPYTHTKKRIIVVCQCIEGRTEGGYEEDDNNKRSVNSNFCLLMKCVNSSRKL